MTVSSSAFELRLDQRTMLITGGAGGLCAPTARACARAGARVIVADRNEQAGRALVDSIREARGDAQFLHLDLDSPGATATAVRAMADASPIDILLNAAGIYPSKPMLEYSLDEYERVQRVNATSAFACCQAVAPGMIARGWGRVINVSSITVSGAWENLAPYVVSKGSLIAMTRAAARELGSHGITVNTICPGAFPTVAEKIHDDTYSKLVIERQAVKRRAVPDDFSYAVLFFASEYSGFITGQSLNVDGGWVMQ